MKRNSTTLKAQSIDQRTWNERQQYLASENIIKSKYDYPPKGQSFANAYKNLDSFNYRSEYLTNSNFKNSLESLQSYPHSNKIKEEQKNAYHKSIENKARNSSYRPSIKTKNQSEYVYHDEGENIPSIHSIKNAKRAKNEQEIPSHYKNSNKNTNGTVFNANDQIRRSQADNDTCSFPKVSEKLSKNLPTSKNTSQSSNNAFKDIGQTSSQHVSNSLGINQTMQSFLSGNSGEYSSQGMTNANNRTSMSKNSKPSNENYKNMNNEPRSNSNELSQPHISLNAGITNKVVSLMPARSSTFLFNGKEAYYAVNTTNGIIRTYNEDRVSIVINIKRKSDWKHQRWPNCSYFSIFDGHGGALCADFLKDNLHKMILENSNFPDNPVAAIEQGCAQAEHDFCKFALKQTNIEKSGSCGIVLLIIEEKVYLANIGDSRAIVSEMGGKSCSNLTTDHKPEELREKERIERNGGKVMKNNYLDTYKFLMPMLNNRICELPFRLYPGGLSVSRSFGDITAKDVQLGGNPNVLIAKPDVYVYTVDKNTDFIYVGCYVKR